jgi:GMP synthase (glutamine-hydrolysing)
MKVHYLQHVSYEDPAYILEWFEEEDHDISYTRLHRDEPLPTSDDYDLLLIMGGPMSIYDYATYPWLKDEKWFIEEALDNNKHIIGICLGAQILADVLGARISKNDDVEIGWFPIRKTQQAKSTIFDSLPENFTTFHWHGDTFEIPQGGVWVAESEACRNQAFLYSNNVLGLQYHMEITKESINDMLKHAKADISEGPYIQTPEQIIKGMRKNIKENNKMTRLLIDNFLTEEE